MEQYPTNIEKLTTEFELIPLFMMMFMDAIIMSLQKVVHL